MDIQRTEGEDSCTVWNGTRTLLILRKDGFYTVKFFLNGRLWQQRRISELELMAKRLSVESRKLRNLVNGI